ncbi:MAG: hypothetical protein IJ769_03755 [Clostridia bacterium]|nr:hypothetical protein [Clostridia bacterium]
MRINRDYEQEIDLRDLFFDILYHWRSILVAALIGAILLGAYQYMSITNIHKEGKQTKEEKQYEIDMQNYSDSIESAKSNIKTYTKLIKEKSDYLKESVYMSLDSQNEWLASKRYYIKVDQSVLDALPDSVQEDPADYVAAVYISTLKSGLDSEEMEALLGTGKKEYIDELVGIWADNAANTISVQVIGEDRDLVVEQLDYFIDRLMNVAGPMAQEVGAHTLVLMNEDILSRTDGNLSAQQDEINQQIIEWQEALKEQRETLNTLEDESEPAPPGMHIKRFAVIGFIFGAFLFAAIHAIRYITSDKLRYGGELAERYSIPLYGELTKSRARRRGKGVDKLIEKWEFKHAITDSEILYGGIAALMKERCASKRVLLTGTVSEQALVKLRDELGRRLGDACAVNARGDLLRNADAISEAKQADAVILVEEKYASRTADIERAAELLEISEANVNGYIVV